MTVTFTSLAECIKMNDHMGFLRSYMQLVIAGKNLHVPTSLEYMPVKEAWEEILFGVPGGYTDEFLINVSNIWIRLCQKQGNKIDDNFARDILDILEGKTVKKRSKTSSDETITTSSKLPKKEAVSFAPGMPMISHTTVDAITDKKRRAEANPKLSGVDGSVSQSYYVERDLSDFKLPPVNDMEKNMMAALKQRHVDTFLFNYLGMSKTQLSPRLPMTSVLDLIYLQWREILLERFSTMPPEIFLKQLSKRWFYLVNKRGLPSQINVIHAILHDLVSEGINNK